MKKNKKEKIHSFKRKLAKIFSVLMYTIIALCVGLVIYIILCEEGIITLSSNNQIQKKQTMTSDVVDLQQEIFMNREDSLQEQKNDIAVNGKIAPNIVSKEEENTTIIPIQIIGDVDKQNIKMIEEELKLLPVELVEAFIEDENHWEICITDEDIRSKYYAGRGRRCMALTIYDYYKIEIENRQEAAKNVPIHEMGHYLDYKVKQINNMNEYPSLTPEFLQIYQKEVNEFVKNIENGSCVSDSREFFAETFYYYVKDPSKCTPEATEYIQTQLNILKETYF